ncbi:J domain-containing protein [Siccirubricoccus phaeus]|uniref:molecular chaperone DnaJ n=1 Tax=Siccirubricoccus phaeus TaxID=2595053 RepID=UPI0011F35F55|nr:molecular chaperone DnaJ [Siccirubricoccus phaeus]
MLWLALGAATLLVLLLLAQGLARARVETIRNVALGAAAALALGLVVLVLLSGRATSVLWSLLMFAPVLWPRLRGWWANWRFRQRPGAGEGESRVETATLVMRVMLASGEMSGRVVRGPQKGRELAELGLAELLALLADCRAADPESVPLLEAWLDRVAPAWREAEAGAPPPLGGKMTRAEALEVLGLAEGAGEAEIRAAHRRLMRGAHPDQGGSDWLAARINQARDVLLG